MQHLKASLQNDKGAVNHQAEPAQHQEASSQRSTEASRLHNAVSHDCREAYDLPNSMLQLHSGAFPCWNEAPDHHGKTFDSSNKTSWKLNELLRYRDEAPRFPDALCRFPASRWSSLTPCWVVERAVAAPRQGSAELQQAVAVWG